MPIERPIGSEAIRIRPATRADANAIAEIDLHPDVRPWLDLPPEAARGWRHWLQATVRWIENPTHRCVVAVTDDGTLCGSVTLRRSPSQDSDAACLGLKVHPAWSHRGIGSALMRWLLDTTDGEQIDRVYLAVLRTNVRAIRLYQRLGFVYDGPTTPGCDRMVRVRPAAKSETA